MEDVERADPLLFLLRLDGFRWNRKRARVFLDVELRCHSHSIDWVIWVLEEPFSSHFVVWIVIWLASCNAEWIDEHLFFHICCLFLRLLSMLCLVRGTQRGESVLHWVDLSLQALLLCHALQEVQVPYRVLVMAAVTWYLMVRGASDSITKDRIISIFLGLNMSRRKNLFFDIRNSEPLPSGLQG